ncbi:IS110 family transposase [Micromonospora halotolerans]
MPTMTHPTVQVTAGVDTHKDTHTAAALDDTGRLLGTAQFAATPAGHRQLLTWLKQHGSVTVIGVEGTGAYGAGLTRYLHTQDITVVEVDRPDRTTRRHHGKSDPVDAEAAARAALTGRATGIPKQRDGCVEALRQLRIARTCAIRHRADVQQRLHSLTLTAGEALRGKLRDLSPTQLVRTCAALRPDPAHASNPDTATKIALRSLARRHQQLTTDITELDQLINPLVKAINPALSAAYGVGPEVAGQLLVTAGDNPHRLRTEAAFAMLCGVAPLPASSGKTHRHRLNRGGDRQANCAPAPAPTATAASSKASAPPKPSDASSATSPAKSTSYSPLDRP